MIRKRRKRILKRYSKGKQLSRFNGSDRMISMESTVLSAEGISKGFKGVEVLSDISISLLRGEILSIVGESGCGKSTLLRIIAGFLPPDRGRVIFHGKDLLSLRGKELRRERRAVQLIFQSASLSLNPRMRVWDIIGEAAEDKGRTGEYMEMARLGKELSSRRPGELSGGERERVAIARAIAAEPEVLLLDEPVSSLDASLKAGILNLFLDIRDELGISMLLVEHDRRASESVSDRTVFMEKGRIAMR